MTRRSLITFLFPWLTASLITAISGPFGTALILSFADRLAFWSILMGWNFFKFAAWFRLSEVLARRNGWGERPGVRLMAGFAAALLLNLSLPWEIEATYALIGRAASIAFYPMYPIAVVIGVLVSISIHAMHRLWRMEIEAEPAAPAAEAPIPMVPRVEAPPPATVEPTGLLLKAGLTGTAAILAVEAEDHYLRLHLADGTRPLVLYRFRDALIDLAGIPGEQVHRGYWVAANAVTGAERRDGRKWALRLSNGLAVPVSETFLPAVRQRGWLRGVAA